MKKIRKFMLVLLLMTGGFSVTAPMVHAQAGVVAGWVLKGLGRLVGLGGEAAKYTAIAKTVSKILDGTGKMDAKLGELGKICGVMGNGMDSLWRATNTYYNDLKVLSDGVAGYRDLLNFVGHTRDIQGYTGAAINLTARSQYLTLKEYEYVMTSAVSIQEYTFDHLKKLYDIVSVNGGLKMNDYERLQMLKQLSDEQAKILTSARNLVVYVKRAEMRHVDKAKDDAFRESFLNMRL